MRITLLAVVVVCSVACSDKATPLQEMAEPARGRDRMSNAIPILRVDDLKAAQRYYKEKLGFTVEWEDGEPPDFSAVKRGDAVFFLCEQCQGRGGNWSIVFVPDVDKLFKELTDRGAKIRRRPKNEPWKLREMHVADADGNVIRFASNTRHRDDEPASQD